jgi:hypothetical protein
VKTLSHPKQLGSPPPLDQQVDNHEPREQKNHDKNEHDQTSWVLTRSGKVVSGWRSEGTKSIGHATPGLLP